MDNLYDYQQDGPVILPALSPPSPEDLHDSLRAGYDLIAHGEFGAIDNYNHVATLHAEYCGCGQTWIMNWIGVA